MASCQLYPLLFLHTEKIAGVDLPCVFKGTVTKNICCPLKTSPHESIDLWNDSGLQKLPLKNKENLSLRWFIMEILAPITMSPWKSGAHIALLLEEIKSPIQYFQIRSFLQRHTLTWLLQYTLQYVTVSMCYFITFYCSPRPGSLNLLSRVQGGEITPLNRPPPVCPTALCFCALPVLLHCTIPLNYCTVILHCTPAL